MIIADHTYDRLIEAAASCSEKLKAAQAELAEARAQIAANEAQIAAKPKHGYFSRAATKMINDPEGLWVRRSDYEALAQPAPAQEDKP